MIDPRAIEDILIETQSTPGDTSVNLDNQKCLIGHNAERLKHSTRTVYRVCWSDEGNLIGSLLLQGSWERYEFRHQTRTWVPAPTAPIAIPIEALINRGEKNLRDLTRQELHRLREHYRGHKHHWRFFAVVLELTHNKQDPQPEAKQVAQCESCRQTFRVESASYLFRTGRSMCPVCQTNMRVRAVPPPKQRKEEQIHREERREANWNNLKRGRK